MAIREKAQSPVPVNIATSLNNLGLLYLDQGRPIEAEPLCTRALDLHERALPAGDPGITQSIANLAVL
jgi:hypothetical protein